MDLNLLVFEQDHALLNMIKHYAEKQGCHVHGVRDVHTFVKSLQESMHCSPGPFSPQAIIFDTPYPSRGNIKLFLDQYLIGSSISNRPVALISAMITPEEEQMARQMGVEVIKKPFRLSQLGRWLESCQVY